MKRKIFTLVLTLMGSTFLFAQQWTGANNTTGNISRTGKVSINTTNTGHNLNLSGSIGMSSSTTENASIRFYTSNQPLGAFLISANPIFYTDYSNGQSYLSSSFKIVGYDATEKNFVMIRDRIGIGTDSLFCADCNDYRLFVKDGIRTEKIKVDIAANNGWADYVFAEDYNLMPLTQVEQFIKQNGHLPEVPTTQEAIANGIELKEMNILLLKKVEELTLYSIELQKRIEALESQQTNK